MPVKKGRMKKMKRRRSSRFVFQRRGVCRFCQDKQDVISYRDVERLRRFITERGKILPNRISGNCARHQRILARAIKQARAISLLPFTTE